MSCKTGGAVDRWHNRCRDWLAEWLAQFPGVMPVTEQEEPRWFNPAMRKQHAILDIRLRDRKGRLTYVDVVFASVFTLTPIKSLARAASDGVAANDAVLGKRRRYPSAKHPAAGLVPFAVEAHGRPSPEALAFLKAMCRLGTPDRDAILRRARRDLSVITQSRLGDLLLSSEAPYLPP